MSKDFLKKENCNTRHCVSCIFHPQEEKRIKLSPERIEEITNYLERLETSHVCHVTNKTCYGGLEVQAKSLFKRNIISEPTVNKFLETAKLFLNL